MRITAPRLVRKAAVEDIVKGQLITGREKLRRAEKGSKAKWGLSNKAQKPLTIS